MDTLYAGVWEHTIDHSNRIAMPADWREPGAPDRFSVFLSPDESHLTVCTDEVLAVFLQGLRAKAAEQSDVSIPEIERQTNLLLRKVRLDNVGRLPLPREFTSRAGILGRADMVGRQSKFEVWPCGKIMDPSPTRAAAAAFVAQKLNDL